MTLFSLIPSIRIPEEVQLKILSLLDEKELPIAGLVNKHWQRMAQDPSLWRPICQRRWKNLSHSSSPGKNWRKICKKRVQMSKTMRLTKDEYSKNKCKQTIYKLPNFSGKILALKREKQFAFIKATAGTAQIYHLGEKSCQLVYDNVKEENSRLIHYQEGHIIQVTQEGQLYRWKVNEAFPQTSLCYLGNFENAYLAQNHLFLTNLLSQTQFKIVDVRTGLSCYKTTSAAINFILCRNNQALIHCLDGSLYFINDIENSFATTLMPLKGTLKIPLNQELCQFDEARVIILCEDDLHRRCHVWDASNGEKKIEFTMTPRPVEKCWNKKSILTISSYDGKRLAVGLSTSLIITYDPDDGNFLTEANIGLVAPVRFLVVDDSYFLASHFHPEFKSFDLYQHTPTIKCCGTIFPFLPDTYPWVNSHNIHASYDGRKLVFCDEHGWLHLWDFAHLQGKDRILVAPPHA
ncbi:F-box protein [Neochlamydia sp. EPS4]|uniref:F-box protein n=1 Tax=Neochlamydia sp. EPS4 TaxID=1478175 RepID=UPI0005D114E4|nr:F-box-like domain-containing protein [Neochlamydia sp. EPS4]